MYKGLQPRTRATASGLETVSFLGQNLPLHTKKFQSLKHFKDDIKVGISYAAVYYNVRVSLYAQVLFTRISVLRYSVVFVDAISSTWLTSIILKLLGTPILNKDIFVIIIIRIAQ